MQNTSVAYICAMDVICFVENRNGIGEPQIEPIGMGSYLLVRIGLDVDRNRYFGYELEEPIMGCVMGGALAPLQFPARVQSAPSLHQEQCGEVPRKRLWGRRHRKQYTKQCRKQYRERCQREAEHRLERMRAYHKVLDETERSLRALFRQVVALPEPDSSFHMVYEGNTGFLSKRGQAQAVGTLATLWQQYFTFSEFKDYKKAFWLRPILPQKIEANVLVLGHAEAMYAILERSARKIKELRWILFQEDVDEAFLNFVEECYEEHGLVVRYQVISEVTYLGEGISCPVPTTIFDFTGPIHVTLKHAVRECTWVDAMSAPQKQRQLEGLVNYNSLHKIWRQILKKYNRFYFLDSVGEKGYNAFVSVGHGVTKV